MLHRSVPPVAPSVASLRFELLWHGQSPVDDDSDVGVELCAPGWKFVFEDCASLRARGKRSEKKQSDGAGRKRFLNTGAWWKHPWNNTAQFSSLSTKHDS